MLKCTRSNVSTYISSCLTLMMRGSFCKKSSFILAEAENGCISFISELDLQLELQPTTSLLTFLSCDV